VNVERGGPLPHRPESTASAEDLDWEYAPLRLTPEVDRPTAAAQLSLHAEFGGWELARVQRWSDGTRRVVLRRKRRPADALPLPVLPH
jgi:hypothetical protein